MTQLSRRTFAFGLGTFAGLAHSYAQAVYPERPVRVIVPFAPGGSVDTFARIISQTLSHKLGQQFYVENIGGGGGNIGAGQAAKAAPDGHTLLLAFSSFVINPSLMPSVPYDPVKDFEPVMLAVSGTHVIVVTPSVAAKSMAELTALIKSTPGKFSFAHGGVGTPGHLLGEKWRLTTNLDIVPVPFTGAGPAVVSILGGHTPIGVVALSAAASQIAGGQLRALAVTSASRSRLLPDVPTTIEAGLPDIQGELWVGALLPAKTPKSIVEVLHREMKAALGVSDVQEKLRAAGFDVVGSTPDDFATRIGAEGASWKAVIQSARVRLP